MNVSVSTKQAFGVFDTPLPASVIADDSNCLLFSPLTFYLQCDPIYPFSIQTLLVLTHMTGQMPVG